ncbi:MAG: hypothetical protein M9941_19065 [Anaerolineae bacterium]|nr:hypothetical protein [Anaerolineae bacterium]MCO5192636.1 hypothetical protein [Anaerolineae bacterium]MCO5199843.1 hypothetical protein [Anaerolineae bacterium]
MSKYPLEILGKYSTSLEESTWQRNWCPFNDQKCSKKNQVCSVVQSDVAVAICPHRFLQNRLVFAKIALDHFGTTNDILVLSEVYSGDRSLGTFDYVVAKHKPLSSEVEDFVIAEFQTVDTTMTGALNTAIVDLKNGIDVTERNYGFGLNWANVWKRSFIQMLNKGRVLDHWGHKAYWVFQEPAYRKLLDAYNLETSIHKDNQDSTVFVVCDLKPSTNNLELFISRIESSSVQELAQAFSTNPKVPPKSAFLKNLADRIRSGNPLVL